MKSRFSRPAIPLAALGVAAVWFLSPLLGAQGPPESPGTAMAQAPPPGAAAIQEPRSRNPAMWVPPGVGREAPVPPAPKEGICDDPTATVVFDAATRQERVVPSWVLRESVPSGTDRTPPWEGLLPSPESILGPDSRVRVTPTTDLPWKTVVSLDITFPDGSTFTCSGALIGQGTHSVVGFHVLTAGHCVHHKDHGGWFDTIRVMPGRDGSYLPYASGWATQAWSYAGWTDYQNSDHDWALLGLDKPYGTALGFMGRRTAAEGDGIYTGPLHTAGYPGDKPNGELWYAGENGRTADENRHWYYMDTIGGQSGSPVWQWDAGTRYILTVHAYGDDGSGSNSGTRLNQNKFDQLIAWTNEAPPPPSLADLIDDGGTSLWATPPFVPGSSPLTVAQAVRDIGTNSAPGFRVAYYLSTNTIITTGDYLLGYGNFASLEPFAVSPTHSSTFTLSLGVPPGSYYLGWIIDDTNVVAEYNEVDNVGFLASPVVNVNAVSYTKMQPAGGAVGLPLTLALQWQAVAGATDYEYCVDTVNDNQCTAPAMWNSAGTQVFPILFNLAPDTSYYWQVRALPGQVYANLGTWWTFRTGVPPADFGKTFPFDGGKTTIRPAFEWGASAGAASYEACVDTTNNRLCDTTWSSVGTNKSVQFTGAAMGTTYFWQVRAVNTVGVTHANAGTHWSAVSRRTPTDREPDGRADHLIWRARADSWYVRESNTGATYAVQWGSGAADDRPVPGDYDGDGRVDLAVWRPLTGYWYILDSASRPTLVPWGSGRAGDVPVPGDYDGDGRTDPAVWRGPTGTWYILKSTGGSMTVNWGLLDVGDEPVPADYDGDGRTDIAVRRATGCWYILESASRSTTVVFGLGSDVAVPGDYDGDGKADIAVWRPKTGTWYIRASNLPGTGSFYAVPYGTEGDVPVPSDYDGDGRVDIAVWRPATGVWYVRGSLGVNFRPQWGSGPAGDVPVVERR